MFSAVSHLVFQQGHHVLSLCFVISFTLVLATRPKLCVMCVSNVWYHCRVLDLQLWQTLGAWLVQFLCSFGAFSNDSNHYSMQSLRVMAPHITPPKWYGGTPMNCSRSYCSNYSKSNRHCSLGGKGRHLFCRLRVEVLYRFLGVASWVRWQNLHNAWGVSEGCLQGASEVP